MVTKLQQAIDNDLGRPYYIAEIGMNWNGDFEHCLELIKMAKESGADCVKFQMRTPEMHVKPSEWDEMRSSPAGADGQATKLEHRRFMEFDSAQRSRIANLCRVLELEHFYSVFDVPSCARLDEANGICAIKIPSPANNNLTLIKYAVLMARRLDLPVLCSLGMSGPDTFRNFIRARTDADVSGAFFHTVSHYPTPCEECHIANIREHTIGYSGHEEGWFPTVLAVARGARIIERHFTADVEQKGSDHKASLNPPMFKLMVTNCNNACEILGRYRDGPYDCEQASIERLR